MTDVTRLRPSPGVAAFDLDNLLVLYEPQSSMTYVLNGTASSIWKALVSGLDTGSITTELAENAGISPDQVRRDLDLIVDEWVDCSLLGESIQNRADRVRNRSELYVRLGEPAKKNSELESLAYTAAFRLLDFFFLIETSEADLIDEIGELLGHVRVGDLDGSEEPTRLFLRRQNDCWLLFEEGEALASCSARDHMVSIVITFALMLSYLRSPSFAAIHGAAVSHGDRCVLMPGRSGSGKSTLLAALVGEGFNCCTDDMAVLTEPEVRLRPLATPLGLKEGSWAVLSKNIPSLDGRRIYTRADGQRVKYLLPGAHTRGKFTEAPVRVTHLVFPRYSSAGNNLLNPIPRAVALNSLTRAGYDLPGQISEEWLRGLTDWLREMPCYELEHSDLNEAVARIGGLLS